MDIFKPVNFYSYQIKSVKKKLKNQKKILIYTKTHHENKLFRNHDRTK